MSSPMKKNKALREIRKGLRRLMGRNPVVNEGARDFGDETYALMEKVRGFTMTSMARIHAVERAVNFIVAADLPGDFVECGVWRGGSTMAAALTLLRHDRTDRTIWLFDTFEGMPKPSDNDVGWDGSPAIKRWTRESVGAEDRSDWLRVDIDEVRQNVASTGYPIDRVNFVKGMVQDTLPSAKVEKVALLRLDTDFYESTKVELEHLWPKLVPGGILIIDDYGRWLGQRKAVDEFFESQNKPVLIHRIDEYGYIAQKFP